MAQHNRKVPDKNVLARWLDEGLTHEAMAQRTYTETGERVSRAAISMALQRYGLTDMQRPRYEAEVPWRVKAEHLRAYPVRMLRVLGRRRAGETLPAELAQRLDAWLANLERENAVVAYDPDADQGFFYIERQPEDPADIPIHIKRVYMT